jgi:LDH2 family malate/lactate/ureidoglycolate dehydrogenase
MATAFGNREGSPRILRESAISALVDARKTPGLLAARFCEKLLVEKAKGTGVGVIGLTNASRLGRLATSGRRIAEAGVLGLVMCGGSGPPVVAPHGSSSPALGGNPICLSFPGIDAAGPIILDFTTSRFPFSRVLIGLLEGDALPRKAFYDRQGRYTTQARSAVAVKLFGGQKSYALCLGLELLCGAFVGGKMGLDADSEYQLGALFISFCPTLFRPSWVDAAPEVEALFRRLASCRPLDPRRPVRVPGQRSAVARAQALERGNLALNLGTWHTLCQMAQDAHIGGVLGFPRAET